MSTYQQLLSQKAALAKQQADIERQLAAARRAERNQVMVQIKTLMVEHDISLSDLDKIKPATASSSRKKSPRKVPVKYRNPATGEAWSGRGLQPKWLRAALSKGKKLDDFAV